MRMGEASRLGARAGTKYFVFLVHRFGGISEAPVNGQAPPSDHVPLARRRNDEASVTGGKTVPVASRRRFLLS
jgi:hypothetical protein